MKKPGLTQSIVDGLRAKPARYYVRDEGTKSAVTGLSVRVEPSGRKTWYYLYRLHGKQRLTRLGDTGTISLQRARTLARELRGKIEEAREGRGEDPRKVRATPATLGHWIESYYGPRVLAHKKAGAATLDRLHKCFGFLMEKPLDAPDILETVMRWRDDRLHDGLSPVSINRYVSNLGACYAAALEYKVIGRHPLHGLRPLKHEDNKRVRYLSAEEERRLWAALDRREERIRAERDSANAWRKSREYKLLPDLKKLAFADHLKPLVILALYTGLRRGELFSLEWTDVDWQSRTIAIRAAATKTGKARRVPMNEVVLDAMQGWREQTRGKGLVFPHPHSGKRLGHIKSSWAALMRDAEIEAFRFHDCRHHFASMLAMDGVPLNDIRELLGHTTMTMTLRYAHLAPEAGHDAVARLALRHQRYQNVTPFPASSEEAEG